MPVPNPTSLFGEAYLSAANFRPFADQFGVVAGAIPAMYPDTTDGNNKLTAQLASASRTIDTVCGRSFTASAETVVIETHKFDYRTRRITINQPPVTEVIEFKIRTSPSIVSEFRAADVFINNQENYLELASIALATIIALPLQLSLKEPQAEIKYKSLAAVPQKVQLACARQAAWEINRAWVEQNAPAGYKIESGTTRGEKLKIENTFRRNQFDQDSIGYRVAPGVRDLLQEFISFSVA